jgi:ribosomal protein S18 acetylase RimI-like enzyme
VSAALHLAGVADLDRLVALVAAFHEVEGIRLTDAARRDALLPLLEGSPHGAAYLIGPARAPVGYVVVCFGWSVALGGMTGYVDELFVRPRVRGRGIATEVLQALAIALGQAGIRALNLSVDRDNARARRLCDRSGFDLHESQMLMSRKL